MSACTRCNLPACNRLALHDGEHLHLFQMLCPACTEALRTWLMVRLPTCCGRQMAFEVWEAGGQETTRWWCPTCHSTREDP